jgi:predicted esterase
MRYLVGLILILCCLSPSLAQNKDTVLVNLTNFKLYPGTFSWRGTNTYSHIINTWDTSPYTEGHLKQGTVFRMNYRLLKPIGYDANYSPGYPIILMLHGGGERGNCWDTNCYYGTPAYAVKNYPTGATESQLNLLMNNDHVLSNGGSAHLQAVNLAGSTKPNDPNLNGRAFPGFVLFPQNINGWGNEASSNSDISFAIRIVRLLVKQYNIDPNRIYVHGLSFGGQGVFKAMNLADWLFAGAATMSAIYTSNIEVDSMSNIPLWAFQGGQDTQVTPAQADLMITKFRNAGGVARYTLYPNLGHGTWNSAYAEPDFFIWLLSKNKANIHVPFGNPYICGTTGAGVKLSVGQGFYAYQWEKDGQLILGANTNSYLANEPGVYRARFSRISKNPTAQQWNRWSDPVTIGEKSPDKPIIQQVNSIVLNDLNNVKNATLKAPAGFTNYYWYKNGVASALPNTSTVTINGCSIQPSFPCAQSGAYSLVVKGIDQCPSPVSDEKFVILGMSSATNPLPIITKPSNFVGKVTSPSSVLLTWTDVAKNERGYEIWRRKSTETGTQWKLATLTAEDVTLFHDTGLEPSTTYYYKIRGVNNSGRSDYSPGNSNTTAGHNLIVTTTTDTSKPTPPQDLTANVVGINKIILTWTAATDDSGIKDYYVYYGVDSILVGSATTSYTLDNSRLTLNTYYNFTVRAVDFYGNLSSKSNQVSANTFVDGLYYEHSTGAWTDIATIPFLTAVPEFTGKVPNLTLEPRTQDDFFNFRFYGYLYLNTGSTANTTSLNTTYAFRLSSNDGAELWIDDVRRVQRRSTVADGACTSNQIQTLQLAAGYHKIEVRYYDYTGSQCLKLEYRGPDTKGNNTNAPYIVVPDNKLKSYNVTTPPVAPIAPINLAASAISMTQIDLSWAFNGTPPVEYEVFRGTNVSGPFTMVSRISTTVFSDVNLIPGTNYFYKVRTVDNNGTSPYTNAANATTLTDSEAPSQPTGLALASSTFTNASLTWNTSTDNIKVTGYEVWGNGTLLGTSTVTGYMATNLTPNTLYNFFVIAYDASGNKSTPSTSISTTTSTPDIYYSNASGNLNQPDTWGKNSDGSGATATSFSNNGQYFIVSNRTTSSLGGSWSVDGSISKVIVPSDVTLTVDNAFSARVEVQGSGKLDLNHATVPNIIGLSPTSTVNYNTPSNIIKLSYGNLGLGGSGNKVFPSGTLTVTGNLTASNGVALKGASGNLTKVVLSGDLTFTGTPAYTAPDYGIEFEFSKNSTQTISTGGDLYFNRIKTTGSSNVNVINSGTPVSITFGSNAGGGLSISNGTTFNLGNNNLFLSHSSVINGTGENGKVGINGGNLNITSNTTQNSNLYFDPTNNKINYLGIDLTGSGDLIFHENASVSDGIKIKNGELNSNGHITLISNASKTASIQEIEGTGIITGDMKVQRYIDPKGRVYRYISTSVEGVTVANWQNFFPITGAFTGGSTGYTNNPSMFNYDNGEWLAYPPASGNNLAPISKGVGYSAFLRNGTSPITLQVTGNPFQGDITFDLDSNPSPTATNGWNLLGNPYASTIIWGETGWVMSGVNTSVSIRDNPLGDVKYYDYATGLGTLTLGEIAPGQSFWVQSITANPSLTITEKAKTNAQQILYRKSDHPVSHLTMTLKQGLKEDHTFVALTEFGTDEFDRAYDAVKQQNVGLFNFSTLTSNEVNVAINNMGDGFCSKSVKLNIQNVSQGSYALIFDEVKSLVGVDKISLHDNFTSTDFNVTDGAVYNFSITSNINSYGNNRFSLKLTRPEVDTDLSFSSADVCGDDASLTLSNSQNGVDYLVMNNNNEKISDVVTGNGSNVILQIAAGKLISGNNQIQISAGFRGCNSQIIQTSANFKYTELPSVIVDQNEVWACQGSQTTLSASGLSESGHYKWFDHNGNEISNATTATLETALIKNDTEFYVAGVTGDGCEGTKTLISVFVESSEVPSIEFKNDTLFSNGYGSLQWFKNGEPIPGANTNIFKPETSGSYSIAKLGANCTDESAPYEYLVTGDEYENVRGFALSIYPNPTTNENINVTITSQSSKPIKVQLVDILGKALYENSFTPQESEKGIKLKAHETLRSGIYFVTAAQEKRLIKRKIIVTE